MKQRILISNLCQTTSLSELKSFLTSFGPIESVWLKIDPVLARATGEACVVVSHEKARRFIKSLAHRFFKGRSLQLSLL
jgi:hypothetical protein